MQIVNCGIHGYFETLGIDEDELSFYWSLEHDGPTTWQSAYQLVLATKRDFSTENVEWDSGKVASAQQRNIFCRPANGFKATCNYFWKVTVWDHNDKPSAPEINTFFTAYPKSRKLPPWSMNQTYMPHSSLIFRKWFENEASRWKGVWIGNGTDKPFYARKDLTISRKPSRAIIFASGLGHFNLSVNGLPASKHVLDPGWTDYHKAVQFVSYDVTDRLVAGRNAVGAHVGNGFYAGDQGDRFFWPMYEDKMYVRFGNELCFFCEIHLFYDGDGDDDGHHDVVISKPDWKVRESATTLANIYASETHDRRQMPAGWDTANFDDASWQDAKPLTGPKGELRYQSQPPVVLDATFQPVATKTLKPGVVSFDLGQNASTMVQIAVEGATGSEIIVRAMESVDENGFVTMPDPLFKEFETHVYSRFILAGTGKAEVWQPEFSFTSARYIQVEGVVLASDDSGGELPVIHSAVGQHVTSAARRLGTIQTDKRDVNELINACFWTYSSNLFSWHTDCPQIEKFPWLEVTHLLFPATQYVRDIESLHSKILQDVMDAQERSGFVPNMAPEMRYMCGPMRDTITWGCAVCFIPEMLKRYYGSTRMIAKCYPAAKAYVDFMARWECDGGLIEHGLGDWGRDIAYGNHQANIETAVYHQCLLNCAMMARELGHETDAASFDTRARRVYTVYNDLLLCAADPEGGHTDAFYTSRDNPGQLDATAVNQAVALQYHMVPSELVPSVERTFLSAASSPDALIPSGEIGLRHVFATLADLDRPDLVLAMARREEHPSYMRFLRRGETTLCEFWQDECRSKCHDMLGTIYEWMYAAVLGLRMGEEGWKTFEVRPPYGSEFAEVKGGMDGPYGEMKVHYVKKSEGNWEVKMTVPMGTMGWLTFPKAWSSAEVNGNGGWSATAARGELGFRLSPGSYVAKIGGGPPVAS